MTDTETKKHLKNIFHCDIIKKEKKKEGGNLSIITFANQKGGVGKTMTVAAVASILVREGNKVLLIDLDAQRNLDMVAGEFGRDSFRPSL